MFFKIVPLGSYTSMETMFPLLIAALEGFTRYDLQLPVVVDFIDCKDYYKSLAPNSQTIVGWSRSHTLAENVSMTVYRIRVATHSMSLKQCAFNRVTTEPEYTPIYSYL